MKPLLTILLVTFFYSFTIGQGIDFFKGSWEEALEEAKKEDKIIFVDAYATWCGPCKRMSKNVFTQGEVGDFYNKNFVNVKLDMERGEGLKFRKKYPVSAFPTLFYIDYTGEVVQKVKGAQQVEGFIQLGQNALKKVDRSEQFAIEYEKGNRDPELVYNYVRALNKAGKPSLKIANDYIRSQKDLTTPQNLKFILEATTHADSRIFAYLIDHRVQIEEFFSKEKVQEKILMASEATVVKGIEFKSDMLIDEAIEKMKSHYPEKAKAFEYESQMSYALAVKDADGFSKAAKSYGKKIINNNPEKLYALAHSIVQYFSKEPKLMSMAEEFAKKAAEGKEKSNYFITYANILMMNGKEDKAIKATRKALHLAENESPTAVRRVKMFMERLEG